MVHFQIADINISVAWDNEAQKMKVYKYHDCVILPRMLEAFHDTTPYDEPHIKVTVRALNKYSGFDNYKKIYSQSFYRKDDKMMLTMYDPYDNEIPGYTIAMSNDYSCVDYTPHIGEFEHYDLQWMMFPFEGRVLYKGGIVLHGAAIEYDRKGIVFIGHSGAGKSTQAKLWQKHRDALIINGDCPAIMNISGTPKVFGTPWCGTSGESINRSAPLSAIIILKQGKSNSLRELKDNIAFFAILSNVLRSNFDGKSLDLAIENIKNIIGHIRVYELTATISEEAVEILEKEIM